MLFWHSSGPASGISQPLGILVPDECIKAASANAENQGRMSTYGMLSWMLHLQAIVYTCEHPSFGPSAIGQLWIIAEACGETYTSHCDTVL